MLLGAALCSELLSPFLPDGLALPLSSLTRSHSPVRHCPPRCKAASPPLRGSFIPPPPGFLEAHTAIASSLLQPWCPFHLLSSRLFFFQLIIISFHLPPSLATILPKTYSLLNVDLISDILVNPYKLLSDFQRSPFLSLPLHVCPVYTILSHLACQTPHPPSLNGVTFSFKIS